MMCMMPHNTTHAEHGDAHANAPEPSLLDILKRRFALGEITQEQYRDMQQVLGIAGTDTAQVHNEGHQHG
jgi:uncharacterized membrane protein